jgi:peptidyl-prolyl cis-trans isomerase SurA
LSAQKSGDDPILFTVDGKPVHVSEFNYIYSKTNGNKADFSKASLDEYLDLYTKFKLKVKRAKDMQLDTIPALKQELAGYRRQLADSYLIDREVTDRLVKEAFDRSQQDVDISHILITLGEKVTPADTLKAYRKALEAKAKLDAGDPFARVARAYSDDKSVAKNEGRIGYVTALFPNGMYNLETTAYTAPTKKSVGPVRTKLGYHMAYIHNRRPARGEAEVAHILIRANGNLIKSRMKADSLYKLLEAGQDFEALARQFSDDKATATKGGYIGFFGINRYEQSFENATFELDAGKYSKPIQTSVGWHILKLINKKVAEPFDAVKSRLEAAIKKDVRFEIAKEAMVNRIKTDGKFMEFNATLKGFKDSLDQEFLTYKWKASKQKSNKILFTFGKEMTVTEADFAEYAQKSSRDRLRMGRGTKLTDAVNILYNKFVSTKAFEYEERQLEKKYPEFKALMREYEEGILLFEATKMLVWDKASQDTVGLKKFFKTVDGKYQWKKRAEVTQYSLKESSKELQHKIRQYSETHSSQEVMAKFNTEEVPVLTYKEKVYEEGRNEVLGRMDWNVGSLSASEVSKRDKSINWLKIEAIKEPGKKTLKEARGYVVADYQDSLEAEWIEELRKEYKIKVNEDVLKGMMK